MLTRLRIALIAMLALLGLSTPALATDGRTALDLCLNNPNCKYVLGDSGDVTIFVNGEVVYCPPVHVGECMVLGRKKGNKIGKNTLTPDRQPQTTFPSN